MKNIYLLSANKKSLLHYNFSKLVLNKVEKLDANNQNLYITSDEKFNLGDYKLDTFHNQISKVTNINSISKYDQKIILTTDQDLIKDGIQPIEIDFLEWFVKNPSCETVKIIKYITSNDEEIIAKYLIEK